MSQIWFYHLQQQPVQQVLPALLVKCLAQGWKAVVEIPDANALARLDEWLWTYEDQSFLPHGTKRDGDAALHPIFLTPGVKNPNRANVRFNLGGADPLASLAASATPYQRMFVLFDGNDEGELVLARQQWGALKGLPHERAYWSQSPEGRWEKKA